MARFKRSVRRGRSLKRKRRSFKRRGGRRFLKRVKFAINKFAERKYLDVVGGGNVGLTGQFSYFNLGVAPGTGEGQRVGTEIYMRSLKIRLITSCLNATDSGPLAARIIIGCWKDYQNTAPLMSTILEDTTYAQISPYYRIFLQDKKWIPMYDKSFFMDQDNNNGYLPEKLWNFRFSGKRLPMKRTTYNGSNYPDHAYFMLIWTSALNVTLPSYITYTRMTYTDV